VLLVEVHLHAKASGLQLDVQLLGLAAHLALVLATPDRDYHRFGRRELRR
jgi:hypothetical protein